MKNKTEFLLAIDTNDDESVFIGIKGESEELKDYVSLDVEGVEATVAALQEWLNIRKSAVYHTPSHTIQ